MKKEFLFEEISLIVLFSLILNLSVQTTFLEKYYYIPSNNLVFLSYSSITDSTLSLSENMNLRKIFYFVFCSTSIIYIFIKTCKCLYEYQRKNQIVLDKRKIILELFSNYFEGSIHKWISRLTYNY